MDGRLKFHALSNLFPSMPEHDYQDLKANIEANGLRTPITTFQGKILDGRHRYRVCLELGIKPKLREWNQRGSVLQFLLSMNLHRRHLTSSQRALLGADLKQSFEAEARRRQGARTDLRADLREGSVGKASEQAARLVNVSARSVESAIAVKRESTPQLLKAVKQGLVSISMAELIAKLPAEDQERILALGSRSRMRQALYRYRQQTPSQPRDRNEPSAQVVESLIRSLERAAEIIGQLEPRVFAEALVQRFPVRDSQMDERLDKVIRVGKLLTEIHAIRDSDAPRVEDEARALE